MERSCTVSVRKAAKAAKTARRVKSTRHFPVGARTAQTAKSRRAQAAGQPYNAYCALNPFVDELVN